MVLIKYRTEWMRQRIALWQETHALVPAQQAYEAFAKTSPTDADIHASIPDHISPYGRLVSGDVPPEIATKVMLGYCPFCGHRRIPPLLTFAERIPGNLYRVRTGRCAPALLRFIITEIPPRTPCPEEHLAINLQL